MSEPGLACYAYCVVPGEEPPRLDGLAGVDPSFPVEALTGDELAVLVSAVRLEEFGAEALRRNLEDLGWVERTARAHNAVLERVLECEAVVPLRLCTIFNDEAHVRGMLEREHDVLLEALERLRNHTEWSVKVLLDRRALDAAPDARTPAGSEADSPGRAYFARKKLDRTAREEARATAAKAVDEVHGQLAAHATATTLLPPQHPELSGRSGEMVLNGAYLVHRDEASAFVAAAQEMRDRQRVLGLELELSGPWAPYNFVTPNREVAR